MAVDDRGHRGRHTHLLSVMVFASGPQPTGLSGRGQCSILESRAVAEGPAWCSRWALRRPTLPAHVQPPHAAAAAIAADGGAVALIVADDSAVVLMVNCDRNRLAHITPGEKTRSERIVARVKKAKIKKVNEL